MTLPERKSLRKKKAIMLLVESQEYSLAYAMMLAEQLNDEGKLLDNDYEELAEWLEARMEPIEEELDETPENEILTENE